MFPLLLSMSPSTTKIRPKIFERWKREKELRAARVLNPSLFHNPSVIFFSYIFFYNDFWAKEKLVDFLWRKNLIRIFGMPKCRHWGGWLDHVLQAMLPSIVYVPDRRLWIGTRTRHQPFSHNYRRSWDLKKHLIESGGGLTKWVGRFKKHSNTAELINVKDMQCELLLSVKAMDWGFEVRQHVMMQKFSPEKFVWHAAWVWITGGHDDIPAYRRYSMTFS